MPGHTMSKMNGAKPAKGRMPRKGSPEMKARMARLRAMRK